MAGVNLLNIMMSKILKIGILLSFDTKNNYKNGNEIPHVLSMKGNRRYEIVYLT